MRGFQCLSPVDGSLVFEAPYCETDALDTVIGNAVAGQKSWRDVPLAERIKLLQKATDYLHEQRAEIGLEITRQMGRPVAYSPGELAGVKERSDAMLDLAPAALENIKVPPISGYERWIVREPLGVTAVLAPWNYPFLTSINAIIPALAAGNSVILKHSAQTPLVALRYKEAFAAAGLPEHVFQIVFLDHDGAAALVSDPRIDYVAFTGSVEGGRAVTRALGDKFIGAGLELGGKDPAYVRRDADVLNAAINLADGSFFNSGQSCCGVERIYVHKDLFDTFVEEMTAQAKLLKLGNPTDQDTTLGPLASIKGADAVRRQIRDAMDAGAKAHLPVDDSWGNAYLGPQVLTNVSHQMDVMTEESFGPVVGIMAVANDDEAITLMNDSEYGLTASIWSNDLDAAKAIGHQLETGTVFCNRCDYLDPALAWTGVKNSGRGCTLSSLGYEQLTRPKSYHFKHPQEA